MEPQQQTRVKPPFVLVAACLTKRQPVQVLVIQSVISVKQRQGNTLAQCGLHPGKVCPATVLAHRKLAEEVEFAHQKIKVKPIIQVFSSCKIIFLIQLPIVFNGGIKGSFVSGCTNIQIIILKLSVPAI